VLADGLLERDARRSRLLLAKAAPHALEDELPLRPVRQDPAKFGYGLLGEAPILEPCPKSEGCVELGR
jgi:hypothetical protein